MNNIATIGLIAALFAVLAYALYKHVGAAKLKAELAGLKNPRSVVEEALAALKPSPATSPASASPPAPATVAPPAAAAPPAAPPAPAVPASVAPVPVVVNPFIAYRAQGLGIDQVILRRGFGLSEAEIEQAIAAGYPKTDFTGSTPAAPVDPDWHVPMEPKSGEVVVPWWWWTGGGFVATKGKATLRFQVDPGFKGWVTMGGNGDSDSKAAQVVHSETPCGPIDWLPIATNIPFGTLAYGVAPQGREVAGPAGEFIITVDQPDDCGCVVKPYASTVPAAA